MWWKSRRQQRCDSGIAILVTGLVHVAGFQLWEHELRLQHRIESNHGVPTELVFHFDSLPVSPSSPTPIRQKHVQPAATESAIIPRHIESLPAQSKTSNDWYEAASLAAASVVVRSLEPPRLDSKPKTIPKPEISEKGLFDRGPAHIPGTVEHVGGSDFRTWVTSYCYVLSGMGPHGREDKGGCQRSRAAEGGGELFKELKPKYLKEPPPPKEAQRR